MHTSSSKLIGLLSIIRKEISSQLPVGHSFIPFDILLSVMKGDPEGGRLTVKELFTSLPYSDMGIRYHFRLLIKDGWITIENGDRDARLRFVRPTEQLKNKFTLLLQELGPFLKSN